MLLELLIARVFLSKYPVVRCLMKTKRLDVKKLFQITFKIKYSRFALSSCILFFGSLRILSQWRFTFPNPSLIFLIYNLQEIKMLVYVNQTIITIRHRASSPTQATLSCFQGICPIILVIWWDNSEVLFCECLSRRWSQKYSKCCCQPALIGNLGS